MDLIDYLATNILPLPWTVKGPGFLLMILLAFQAVGHFLSLRWISAATTLVTILVLALIMARFGTEIAQWIEAMIVQNPPQPQES